MSGDDLLSPNHFTKNSTANFEKYRCILLVFMEVSALYVSVVWSPIAGLLRLGGGRVHLRYIYVYLKSLTDIRQNFLYSTKNGVFKIPDIADIVFKGFKKSHQFHTSSYPLATLALPPREMISCNTFGRQ